jgi:hypothetical protein
MPYGNIMAGLSRSVNNTAMLGTNWQFTVRYQNGFIADGNLTEIRVIRMIEMAYGSNIFNPETELK